MPLQKNRPLLNAFITIPVALIVLGAFGLCAAALFENLRFISSTEQILDVVRSVRSVAYQQKGFAQNPGEDIWADLAGAGRMASTNVHTNPWGTPIRAVTVGNSAMRIENDLPTHDCRRLALYFLGPQSLDLGLLSVEAQSTEDAKWAQVYPPSQTPSGYVSTAGKACGNAPMARLALIFKVR